MNLNRQSWHYEIADKFTLESPSNYLCGYVWDVICGFVRIIFFIVSLSFVLGVLILFPIYIIACLQSGNFYSLSDSLSDDLIRYSIYFWLFLALSFVTLIDFASIENSFIYSLYKSFKNKTCVKINWK